MTKRSTTVLVPLLLSLAPFQVFAVAGWTSLGKVVELTSTNQLRYLVTLRVAANPSGCRNKVVFYQDHHASGSQQMFRILLEAASFAFM